MKYTTQNLAAIGPMIISSKWLLLMFLSIFLTGSANAQSKTGSQASQELHDKIASLDSAFFGAYNTCDLAKLDTFFTDDVEFYHEKRGLLTTRKSVMEAITKSLCGDIDNKVRRELVKGSLEVYVVDNYGAIEIGEHRFYLTQKGQQEKLDGVGKFVNLWQQKEGQWKISRVFSYGFRSGQ